MTKPEVSKEDVRSANIHFYDRTAFEYAIHEPVVFPWKSHRRVVSVLERISADGGRERALDVGCGLGFVTRYAERSFDSVYGIDLSSEMARGAVENGHRVLIADGARIPFRDETFDTVICYSILHHFYDYRDVLEEAWRVLRREGYLYIDWDPNREYTTSISAKLYRGLSAAYISIKSAFGLLDRTEGKPLKKPTDFDEEVVRLSKLAEYHHHYTPGIKPSQLTGLLDRIGFREIEFYYHDDYISLKSSLDRDLPLRLLGWAVGLATLRRRPSYLKWLAAIARKR